MDLVVVLVVVALIIAAVGAYVAFAVRGGRRSSEPVRATPSPKVNGVRLKPLAEPTAGATPRSDPPPPVAPSPAAVIAAPSVAAPLFDLDLEPLPPPSGPPAEIRWSKQFDPRSGTLDDVARLRLIGDLGVVAKEWCVPLLCQAYEEERRPGHRQAALTSLAACRSRTAAATFRRALESKDTAERAIAADALADLEPPPQPKSRRTAERR